MEERLKFYETGAAPRKNIDVMEEVARHLKAGQDAMDEDVAASAKKKKKGGKKRKASLDEAAGDAEDVKKSAKKAKKAKKSEEEAPKTPDKEPEEKVSTTMMFVFVFYTIHNNSTFYLVYD